MVRAGGEFPRVRSAGRYRYWTMSKPPTLNKSTPPASGSLTRAWQISLPCTRDMAEAVTAEAEMRFADWLQMPTILASEPDPERPDAWRLDLILDHRPTKSEVARLLAALPGVDPALATLEAVPETDWLVQSQAGLEPLTAGRFHVRHDAADPPAQGAIDFLIPASRAFGTGEHETTRGCLLVLDGLRGRGHRFSNIADIGTGTGLLAFAAGALWPRAHLIATDIDPIAIEVTQENAAANHIALGGEQGELLLATAPGANHPLIAGLAPYDLLIANILAGPLIELAPSLVAHLAEGGSLILAGLLTEQAGPVIAAYRARGMRLAARMDNGQWPTLHLRKRRRYGWRRPMRWNASANGDSPGFGSW